MNNLEVDGFEIDEITLGYALGVGLINQETKRLARWKLVDLVIKNLTPESQQRFDDYLEQDSLCDVTT